MLMVQSGVDHPDADGDDPGAGRAAPEDPGEVLRTGRRTTLHQAPAPGGEHGQQHRQPDATALKLSVDAVTGQLFRDEEAGAGLGVEVRDTADGVEWDLRS